ncbi:MAG: hypothetical protein D6698_01725 [Gammaproteobacteria bacterium]|nr:MAG: hypothetical protein D6698_01725 [Gammaproteobacteria bacterium]
MKTMTFTNDEIEIMFDAIDMMCDNADDIMCDEISYTMTNAFENNMDHDVAVKRVIEIAREHARIRSLHERLLAMMKQ